MVTFMALPQGRISDDYHVVSEGIRGKNIDLGSATLFPRSTIEEGG